MNPVVKPSHAKVGEPVRGVESGFRFQVESVKGFLVIDSPGSPVIGEPVSVALAPSTEEGAKLGRRGTDCAGVPRRNRASVNGTLHGGSDELPRGREYLSTLSAVVPGIAKRSSVATRARPAIVAKVIAFSLHNWGEAGKIGGSIHSGSLNKWLLPRSVQFPKGEFERTFPRNASLGACGASPCGAPLEWRIPHV